MAKRTNYSFEKRQKEAKRKKKQAEKLERKRMNKERKAGTAAPPDGEPPLTTDADTTPAGAASEATTEDAT